MVLNYGVGEDSWESLGHQEIKPVHPKGNQSWIFLGRTDAEIPILWPPEAKNWLIWKDPDAGKRLKVGEEGDDRRWEGWKASSTWWTWVWVSSGSWWQTGKPGVLQSMGSQRVGHNWVTELNWTVLNWTGMEAFRREEAWRRLFLGCPNDSDQNLKGCFQIPQYNERKGTNSLNEELSVTLIQVHVSVSFLFINSSPLRGYWSENN